MVERIRKRDGSIKEFCPEKITNAIFKAAMACGGDDYELARHLCEQVVALIEEQFSGRIPDVESIQDLVERTLIKNGHAKTAKAYILYREKRTGARNA
ncbi:MAG TPA: ATP cone domain-containing protein, partial [Candidatus Hydrogenedentes bacterium]|nr:ATP cone domain-containing protein [Candidatus Hydrogenedentota bacterium]